MTHSETNELSAQTNVQRPVPVTGRASYRSITAIRRGIDKAGIDGDIKKKERLLAKLGRVKAKKAAKAAKTKAAKKPNRRPVSNVEKLVV